MSERRTGEPMDYSPQAEDRFEGFAPSYEQKTFQGDCKVDMGEPFNKNEIDFGMSVRDVILRPENIDCNNLTVFDYNSFNNEIFKTPEEVIQLILKLLPDELSYDQYGKAEITLDVSNEKGLPVGWTGIKPLSEVMHARYPKDLSRDYRQGRREGTVEDGIEGSWFPETILDSEGIERTVLDGDGKVNKKGYFEPAEIIATVPQEYFRQATRTNKITVIIEKNMESGKPEVALMYTGVNRPDYPVKYNTRDNKTNTLKDSPQANFWREHAYMQTEKEYDDSDLPYIPYTDARLALERRVRADILKRR